METSIVCYLKSLQACVYMYMEQINWNSRNSSAYLLSLFILLSHIHFLFDYHLKIDNFGSSCR